MRASEAYQLKPASPQYEVKKSNFNLPNCLTVSRILLIPVFALLFSNPTDERSLAAAFVFGVAALTDLLDGYLARRHGQITNLGKLLDPVADKLLVVTGLVLLVQYQRVETWVVIVMIIREIVVTGLRSVAAKEGVVVPADSWGKLKVVCQVFAILFLILQDAVTVPFFNLHVIGTLVLYLALFLAMVSGGRYMIEIWGKITTSHT